MNPEMESLNTTMRWIIFAPIATVLAGILLGHLTNYIIDLYESERHP